MGAAGTNAEGGSSRRPSLSVHDAPPLVVTLYRRRTADLEAASWWGRRGFSGDDGTSKQLLSAWGSVRRAVGIDWCAGPWGTSLLGQFPANDNGSPGGRRRVGRPPCRPRSPGNDPHSPFGGASLPRASLPDEGNAHRRDEPGSRLTSTAGCASALRQCGCIAVSARQSSGLLGRPCSVRFDRGSAGSCARSLHDNGASRQGGDPRRLLVGWRDR